MPRDTFNLTREEQSTGPASKNRSQPVEQATYYKPSYKMLNYTTWSTDVSGKVAYEQVIGQTSQGLIDKIVKNKEEERLVETYNGINQELSAKALDWKRNSETGEGYLAYISGEHARLSKEALGGIINPMFASRMRTMLMKSKADWENGAFEEEQSMRTAYSLWKSQESIQDLCFEVMNNPFTYESGKQAMETALESYKQVAGIQAYEKEHAKCLEDFAYAYGLGLVQKDPWNFEALAKDGRLNVLSPSQLMHLGNLAKGELKSREAARKRIYENVEFLANAKDFTTKLMLDGMMKANGAESVSNTIIEEAIKSPKIQERVKELRQEYIQQDEKTRQELAKMQNSAENLEGIGGFHPKAQIQYLRMSFSSLLDAEGNAKGTPRDYIRLGNELGVSTADKEFTSKIVTTCLYSKKSPQEIYEAALTYRFARDTGSKLIPKASDRAEYVIDQVIYKSGGDSTRAIEIRDEAMAFQDKIEADPTRRETLAQGAEKFIGSKDYKELQNAAWKSLKESSDLDKFWESDEEKALKNVAEEEFKRFYRTRMNTKIRNGWLKREASEDTIREFQGLFGRTKLVPNKLMKHPPEKEYPGLSDKVLAEKFRKFAKDTISVYTEQNHKPGGYELSLKESTSLPVIIYNNRTGSEGQAPLNIEWNEKKQNYELYILTKDGVPIWFTNADGSLVTINFNKVNIEEESKKQ